MDLLAGSLTSRFLATLQEIGVLGFGALGLVKFSPFRTVSVHLCSLETVNGDTGSTTGVDTSGIFFLDYHPAGNHMFCLELFPSGIFSFFSATADGNFVCGRD